MVTLMPSGDLWDAHGAFGPKVGFVGKGIICAPLADGIKSPVANRSAKPSGPTVRPCATELRQCTSWIAEGSTWTAHQQVRLWKGMSHRSVA